MVASFLEELSRLYACLMRKKHEYRSGLLSLKSFTLLMAVFLVVPMLHAQAPKPLPDPRALMQQVSEHQRLLEKVRENYTFTALDKTEELDGSGAVRKTETNESECFFVHSHSICRLVKKEGKPLDAREEKKESERVQKLVEKAQNTPPEQPLEGQGVSVSRILAIMDVSNPRRVEYRGRPTIVFDFAGRKDAQTSGMAEDMSKKLNGSIWVDESDLEIAHLEARFIDNFKVGGGLLMNLQKGSSFYFDQAPVNGELWLPTIFAGNVSARVLVFKGERQHFIETVSNYQRFKVDAEQQKSVVVNQPAAATKQ